MDSIDTQHANFTCRFFSLSNAIPETPSKNATMQLSRSFKYFEKSNFLNIDGSLYISVIFLPSV